MRHEANSRLKLRIPGWAKETAVRVNQRTVAAGILPAVEPGFQPGGKGVVSSDAGQKSEIPGRSSAGPGGRMPPSTAGETLAATYVELRRVWQRGDIVDLDLPMPVRLIEANPLVEEDVNQVAVQRGPVVYCLESPDLPRGTLLSDVIIPANISLRARYDQRLLGGVTVVEGQGLARPAADWTGKLYREFQPADLKPVKVRFIPYSVWANRGPSEMTVWVPRGGM